MTTSRIVPDTTPSWPRLATARANSHPEMATPMPPWMMRGSGVGVCMLDDPLAAAEEKNPEMSPSCLHL